MTGSPARIRSTLIRMPGGDEFLVRPGTASDVTKVTALIHDAFTIWKERGLTLGPMRQTDEQTAAHLVGKGYVAENSSGELSGTFSLEEGAAKEIEKNTIRFTGGVDDDAIDYPRIGETGTPVPRGRLLVFKKAAVKRSSAGSGLGSALYALAERTARENDYAGMILETVKEASWLYDWYGRLGFRGVGSFRYPGRPIDTILMIKPFETAKGK